MIERCNVDWRTILWKKEIPQNEVPVLKFQLIFFFDQKASKSFKTCRKMTGRKSKKCDQIFCHLHNHHTWPYTEWPLKQHYNTLNYGKFTLQYIWLIYLMACLKNFQQHRRTKKLKLTHWIWIGDWRCTGTGWGCQTRNIMVVALSCLIFLKNWKMNSIESILYFSTSAHKARLHRFFFFWTTY